MDTQRTGREKEKMERVKCVCVIWKSNILIKLKGWTWRTPCHDVMRMNKNKKHKEQANELQRNLKNGGKHVVLITFRWNREKPRWKMTIKMEISETITKNDWIVVKLELHGTVSNSNIMELFWWARGTLLFTVYFLLFDFSWWFCRFHYNHCSTTKTCLTKNLKKSYHSIPLSAPPPAHEDIQYNSRLYSGRLCHMCHALASLWSWVHFYVWYK